MVTQPFKVALSPPPAEAKLKLDPPIVLSKGIFNSRTPNKKKRLIFAAATIVTVAVGAGMGIIRPFGTGVPEVVASSNEQRITQEAVTAPGSFAAASDAATKEKLPSANLRGRSGAPEDGSDQRSGEKKAGKRREVVGPETFADGNSRPHLGPLIGNGDKETHASSDARRSQGTPVREVGELRSPMASSQSKKLDADTRHAAARVPPSTAALALKVRPDVGLPVPTVDPVLKTALDARNAGRDSADRNSGLGILQRAAEAPPSPPSSADANVSVSSIGLDPLRSEAAQQEREARWTLALRSYEKALSIDPTATFAQHGKQRVEKLARLQQDIDYYLANPTRLQSPDPLKHAKDLLVAAEGSQNSGEFLQASQQKLRNLVDRLGIAVPIMLRSDAETQVSIYRIGTFGQFMEQRLTLSPGEYLAVGTRDGYRDVRIRFRVFPDARDTVIEIRCEERI